METYMKNYIESFKFKSIDSKMFKNHFIEYFNKRGKGAQIAGVKWDKWLYGKGMPPVIPE